MLFEPGHVTGFEVGESGELVDEELEVLEDKVVGDVRVVLDELVEVGEFNFAPQVLLFVAAALTADLR